MAKAQAALSKHAGQAATGGARQGKKDKANSAVAAIDISPAIPSLTPPQSSAFCVPAVPPSGAAPLSLDSTAAGNGKALAPWCLCQSFVSAVWWTSPLISACARTDACWHARSCCRAAAALNFSVRDESVGNLSRTQRRARLHA